MELLIGLIAGAVGGNVAAMLFRTINMGTLWNSVAGILGGGVGASILSMLGAGGVAAAAAGGALEASTILSQIAVGGVGGGVLLAIVGLVRAAFRNQS